LGESQLYYLLSQFDPDFPELFKVAADFDDRVPRNSGNTPRYAKLLTHIAERDGLRPLDLRAIARVVEHASRLTDDAERLTLHMRPIVDLLYEADYWAGKNGNGRIMANDVQRAIDAQIWRADRIRERSH